MNYGGAGILEKILSTVSKGLGIASQLIPLYQESEPIIKGAQSIYNSLKDKNKVEDDLKLPHEKELEQKKEELAPPLTKEKAKNSPQFFI